jgi:tRNA modification GTPase
MLFPAINDTIIAVSSGWQASPLGIVRLSGPDAYRLASSVGLRASLPDAQAPSARIIVQTADLTAGSLTFPATAYCFRAPRSYTGQDLIEFHVPGCLPLLRELCALLIEHGARRALPGEFTARAYLAGKLGLEQVEDVLATISADQDSEQRQQRRVQQARLQTRRAGIREKIADLLALIEAGIDFAEEEDVRFLSAEGLRHALDELLPELVECSSAVAGSARLGRPHVAIVGLPNAGKSTLFNSLLGYERAIVSPVLGTTRDVLSAEMAVDGVQILLQDCAGLGRAADDLALAAHLAAERNAAQADLILWVQAWDAPWDSDAAAVLNGVPPQRRILVLSKSDLAADGLIQPRIPSELGEPARVSAASGEGLAALRSRIGEGVSRIPVQPPADSSLPAVGAAVARARSLADSAGLEQPELIALELRGAYEHLEQTAEGIVEELLGRLFSEFCIGK